jgi:solute carrier family 25 (mitochondrial carnitine/acylcarnitine transporter), member 20/29
VFVTPIENVKTKLQVQYGTGAARAYTGPIDCAASLFRTAGIRGLYAGFVPTIFHRGSNWAYFGGYDLARRSLVKKDGTPLVGRSLTAIIAGAFAGTTFWLSCYPIDVIKGRMQAAPVDQPYRSLRQCAASLYQAEGVRGFFRGFTPCLIRSVPANSAAFLAFDFTMRQLTAR